MLRGRCLPYGEGITFWPIAEVVKEAAGITEQESAAAARAKIEALLPEGGESPRTGLPLPKPVGPGSERDRLTGVRAVESLTAAGLRASDQRDMAAAVNLLSRAAALLPRDDPARLEVLPHLAASMLDNGDYEPARAVVAEISAAAPGDRRLEAYALLLNTNLTLATASRESSYLSEISSMERAVEMFREVSDQRGLEEASFYLIFDYISLGYLTEAGRVGERFYKIASRGKSSRRNDHYSQLRIQIAFTGPTPVPAVIQLCEETLASPLLNRGSVANTMRLLGGLRAMQGDFFAACELVSRAHAIYEDFGMKIGAAMGACEMAWYVEMPQDPAGAEKEFRRGYELLEDMGETGMRSSVAAYLSHALVRVDRIDEAERFTILSEELASSDDYISQTAWRSARAHVFARRGRLEEAVDLAREAVLIAEPTSDLNRKADGLVDLAEVLHRAHRSQEAPAAAAEALELYEAKGNLVGAARARTADASEG